MGDFGYRTREEVEDWKTRCPIRRLRERINDDAALAKIDAEVARVVEDAARFAESSPWPDCATAADHVYAAGGFAEPPSMPPAAQKSWMQATFEALSEEMERNPRIFVLGEGIGKRGGNFKTTAGLYDKYGPERLCDTPICERGFVGLACGAAMTGTRPV